SRRADELRHQHYGYLSSDRCLCRSHPQGCEARGLTGYASDEVRVGDQSPDRPDVGSRRAGVAAQPCRRGDRVRRRAFITLLAAAAGAGPLGARAKQPMPVVGYLDFYAAEPTGIFLAAFRKGLSETGFIEGRNLAIEYRYANTEKDRLPQLV